MGTEYKKYFTYVTSLIVIFTCACSGAWLFGKGKVWEKKLYSFGKQTAGGTDERGNSSAWRKSMKTDEREICGTGKKDIALQWGG